VTLRETLSNWRDRLLPERHSFSQSEVLSPQASELRFTSAASGFELIARLAYRYNGIARACIQEIATSVAEPALQVQRRNSEGQWKAVDPGGSGPAGPVRELARLLLDPARNGLTSPYDWKERFLTEYQLYGNAFALKRRFNGSNRPGGLQILPVPQLYVERFDPRDPVQTVYYRKTGQRSLVADRGDTPIPRTDLLHAKIPDPLDDFWGLPPIATAMNEIVLDAQALRYLRAFFKGGQVSGILSTKTTTKPEQRREIKLRWREEFGSGGENQLGIAVLDGDVSYKETGTRPDKLKIDQISDLTESRICSAFGVPPVLVGVRIGIMRATDTNYRNARISFWKETLRPMYTKIGESLTIALLPEFGLEPGDVRIVFNLDAIEELQEAQVVLWERAVTAYDKGLLTRNEARKIVSQSSDAGGEHYKTKSSDGQAAKPDAIPKPQLPKPVPAAAPARKPAQSGVTPDLEESSSGQPPGNLHLVPEIQDVA
jgi:HK97 family phage portal protein